MSISPKLLLINNNKILSVSSFIYNRSNKKVLIIKRGMGGTSKNLLSFPGGKFEVDKDSNYLSATKREVMEETGLKITFPEFHLLEVLNVNKYLIITSISEYVSKVGNMDKTEISDMFWLSKDEIEREITEKNSTKYLKEIIYKGFRLADFTFGSSRADLSKNKLL